MEKLRAELAAQREAFTAELAAQREAFTAELAAQREAFTAELAAQREVLSELGMRFQRSEHLCHRLNVRSALGTAEVLLLSKSTGLAFGILCDAPLSIRNIDDAIWRIGSSVLLITAEAVDAARTKADEYASSAVRSRIRHVAKVESLNFDRGVPARHFPSLDVLCC